jgi:rhamnosyltransferase
MGVTVAIVAHFDPDDQIDDMFRELLTCLSRVCDRIILVTTSRLPADACADLWKVEIVRRPNIGYDFMSYRAGVMKLNGAPDLHSVLLLNSSFMVLNPEAFTDTLRGMVQATSQADVVGLTESEQIQWHLQSYLLAFSSRAVRSAWFQKFFEAVTPLNTKLEVIMKFELGLSRVLNDQRVQTETFFRISTFDWLSACCRWLRKISKGKGIAFWLSHQPYRHWAHVNLTQFAVTPLARQHGIIKTEVLRGNPDGVDSVSLKNLCSDEKLRRIEELMKRLRACYQRGSDGLETLAANNLTIDPRRVVTSSRAVCGRSRVAVALHLYYADLIPEICESLKSILEPFDLYITTPFEADVPSILDTAASVAACTSVCVVENRGRDVRPFLMLLRSGLLDGYNAVLKIHGKKSMYSARGADWRRQLNGDLFGTSLTALKSIALFDDPAVGIVGPLRFFLTHPQFGGANEGRLAELLTAVGLTVPPNDPPLAFYAGSMFWFRPEALAPLALLPESLLAFEDEAGQQNYTLAHACERAFALIARHAGYRCTAASLGGSDIFDWPSLGHTVPVL